MTGYIRDPVTLAVLRTIELSSYELPIPSVASLTGKITTAGQLSSDYSNHIFSLDGMDNIYVITESKGDDESTTMTVAPFVAVLCDHTGECRTTNVYDHQTDGCMAQLINTAVAALPEDGNAEEQTLDSFSRYLPSARMVRSVNGRMAYQVSSKYVLGEESIHLDGLLTTDLLEGMKLGSKDIIEDGEYRGTKYFVDPAKFFDHMAAVGVNVNMRCENHAVRTYVYPELYAGMTIKYGDLYYTSTGVTYDSQGHVNGFVVPEEGSATPVEYQLVAYEEPTRTGSVVPYTWKYYTEKLDWAEPLNYTTSADPQPTLMADITVEQLPDRQTVTFNDGHSELKSFAAADDIVSCVSISFLSTDGRIKEYGYSLNDDGTVTESNANQIQGSSISLFKESQNTYANITWAEGLETAEEEFGKNSSECKVEFFSDKELRYGQPVRLILSGRVFDTDITSAMKLSTDNRIKYTCGNLPTTGSEIMQANNMHYGRKTPRTAAYGAFYVC